MSWLTPTADDLKTKLLPQVTAILTNYCAKTGASAEDVIGSELTNAIREVRGYVAGNKENLLGEDGSIPDELLTTTLIIARHNLYSNLPGAKGRFDEELKGAFERAARQLRDVAAGTFKLVSPDTPSDKNIPRPKLVVISGNPRRNARDTMASL